MAIPPLVLQTAASLAAILALAALAWWLKLGGSPRLDSEDGVRRAAGEVEDGFAPVAVACDANGASALARDAAERIMLIKRHGNRFAGRILSPAARARVRQGPGGMALDVDSGEAWFGTVTLVVPEAGTWASAIDRLSERQDA